MQYEAPTARRAKHPCWSDEKLWLYGGRFNEESWIYDKQEVLFALSRRAMDSQDAYHKQFVF